MNVVIKWHDDMWQEIKDSAMWTIGKDGGKYPDSDWKRRILMSEHSPIRDGRLIINVYDVPTFVVNHFVRHHDGFTPFVQSKRPDRSEWENGKVPDRFTLIGLRFDGNFQSFINISRKRYCNCASPETREVWKLIMKAVKEFEPELYAACARECVYRNGLCPEMFTCKFNKTDAFKKELVEYRKGFEKQIVNIPFEEN